MIVPTAASASSSVASAVRIQRESARAGIDLGAKPLRTLRIGLLQSLPAYRGPAARGRRRFAQLPRHHLVSGARLTRSRHDS